jgi:hypothetical protein
MNLSLKIKNLIELYLKMWIRVNGKARIGEKAEHAQSSRYLR